MITCSYEKIVLTSIALALLIGAGYFYTDNLTQTKKTSVGSNKDDLSTLICGKKFYTQKYFIQGIDVTQRIVDLINSEFSTKEDKTNTNCYWLEQGFRLYEHGNVLKTEVYEYDTGYAIHITSVKTKSFYLGEGFIIDKMTYDVYNMNAYDSEKGSKIGNLIK